MPKKNPPTKRNGRHRELWTRSLAKTLTYRIAILILDFTVVFLLTKKTQTAAGFMIVSNVYTSFGYYLHERAWNGIHWGRVKHAKP
jgi:uncharacterized membrane protein